MQVGQLHAVADGLDLRRESTDVVVAEVRHLLEDEVGDLRPRDALDGDVAALVHEDRVADPDLLVPDAAAAAHDPLLVLTHDDQEPVLVEDLLDDDDLTGDVLAVHGDDVHRLVESHLTADAELVGLDGRTDGDVHLATPGQHVHGTVLGVDLDDHRVGGRRLGEPLELLTEGDDLLAGVLERAHEALVLRGDGRRLGLLPGEVVAQLPQLTRLLGGRFGGHRRLLLPAG